MRSRSTLFIILASTALSTALNERAGAQTPPASSTSDVSTSPITRHNTDKPAPAISGEETVRVVGHSFPNGATGTQPGGGLITAETSAKAQTTVTRDFLAKLSPTTSAAQMIQYAPGANVSSSDPFGLSDAVDITIRGLGQDEIGFLYEGMPVADVDSYLPYTSEWGDTENYQSVSLAQGTVDLDDPLINAAGGVVSVNLREPSHNFGGLIDYSYGSHKTEREFIRVDTGNILNTGVYGFVSFSNATYGQARGAGRGYRPHVDSKFVKEWGDNNRVALATTFSTNNTPTYDFPTLADYKQYGDSYNYDANGVYRNGSFDSNYWKLQEGGWRDLIMSMPSHFTLMKNLSLSVTPYFYWGSGGGGYGTTIAPSPNFQGVDQINTPLVYDHAETTYAYGGTQIPAQAYFVIQEFHPGVTTHLDWTVGNNALTGGWWYDYYDDHQAQAFQQVTQWGGVPNIWGSRMLKFPNGEELEGLDYHLFTQINGLFVGDTLSLLNNKLEIAAGFREEIANRYGTNNLPGPQYEVGANDAQPLPRFSIKYNIDDHNMVFADASGNSRLPAATSYFTSYDVYSGSVSSVGNTDLKSEYSIQEEIGYRYNGPVIASITGFNYNFTNRIVSTITSLNGALENAYINAGGQTTRGVDISAGLKPWHHFSPYVSGEYLYATTDNNLPAATASGGLDYLPTTGKISVRSPRWTTTGAISYDDGTFFGNLLFKWTDSQFGDFMNEERIPAHSQTDMSLGVRLPTIGYAKHPQLQLNLINLSNNHFLSGVYETTLNANTTRGVFGGSIAGSSPTYFVGSGFGAIATFTTGF